MNMTDMRNRNIQIIVHDLWKEFGVSHISLHNRCCKYFGSTMDKELTKEESIELLVFILERIQKGMSKRFSRTNSEDMLAELFAIHDLTYRLYIEEKNTRARMCDLKIAEEDLNNALGSNSLICKHIIDATNLWIENCVLHQNVELGVKKRGAVGINVELLIDMYVYGFASAILSLLKLSGKQDGQMNPYYGIKLTPYAYEPVKALKRKTLVYFDALLRGNQNILNRNQEHAEHVSNAFEAGFFKTFSMEFSLFLSVLRYFAVAVFEEGKVNMVTADYEYAALEIEQSTLPTVSADLFRKSFMLSCGHLSQQQPNDQKLIWKMGINKFRYELCPFILLENNKVLVSYSGVDQCVSYWFSAFRNGGQCYTNVQDELYVAMGQMNEKLSSDLVDFIRESLKRHYTSKLDAINVKYDRIFGKLSKDYGDYDLVFYCENNQELFLIEAKFFSNSFSGSSLARDYNRIFGENGYYKHCRDRYDLVISNPVAMKEFIGVKRDEQIEVHFLFVSSKPMEIKLQDTDGVVCFLCASNLDSYLEGRFRNENDCIIRPTQKI